MDGVSEWLLSCQIKLEPLICGMLVLYLTSFKFVLAIDETETKLLHKYFASGTIFRKITGLVLFFQKMTQCIFSL